MTYCAFKRCAWGHKLYHIFGTAPSGTRWIYLLDSFVNDLRFEFVFRDMGDGCTARNVGGDDADTLTDLPLITVDRMNISLAPWETIVSERPKTQILLPDAASTARFHGHFSDFGVVFRPEDEAIDTVC